MKEKMSEETFKKLEEISQVMVSDLLALARGLGHHQFQSFFCGGIIANVIGNFTDAEWAKFSQMKPCGVPGCDCHIKFAEFVRVMGELRDDHGEYAPKTITE